MLFFSQTNRVVFMPTQNATVLFRRHPMRSRWFGCIHNIMKRVEYTGKQKRALRWRDAVRATTGLIIWCWFGGEHYLTTLLYRAAVNFQTGTETLFMHFISISLFSQRCSHVPLTCSGTFISLQIRKYSNILYISSFTLKTQVHIQASKTCLYVEKSDVCLTV